MDGEKVLTLKGENLRCYYVQTPDERIAFSDLNGCSTPRFLSRECRCATTHKIMDRMWYERKIGPKRLNLTVGISTTSPWKRPILFEYNLRIDGHENWDGVVWLGRPTQRKVDHFVTWPPCRCSDACTGASRQLIGGRNKAFGVIHN